MHHWAGQLANDYLPDGWEPVSSSAFTRIAVNRKRQLYYKEFLSRSPAATLMARVGGSRAVRARMNGEDLLLAGIDAPETVLWGRRPGGVEYLFTTAAPGEGIHHWLHAILVERTGEQLRLRRQLLRALGTCIGRVHATGFILGDLTPRNVLAALQQEQFRFTFIDNEHNARKTPAPGRMLLRNLMQLNLLTPGDLSRTDRMRFFCAWRQQMRDLSPMETKILATEAYHWALQQLRDKGQL
ncbi:MAG TPA: lipopolysaccharide kinase InaA family protein [Halioglobus sp.]